MDDVHCVKILICAKLTNLALMSPPYGWALVKAEGRGGENDTIHLTCI